MRFFCCSLLVDGCAIGLRCSPGRDLLSVPDPCARYPKRAGWQTRVTGAALRVRASTNYSSEIQKPRLGRGHGAPAGTHELVVRSAALVPVRMVVRRRHRRRHRRLRQYRESPPPPSGMLPLLLRARARSYVPARNPSLGQTANSTAVHNRIMFYIFSDPARARHFTVHVTPRTLTESVLHRGVGAVG